MKTNLSNTDIPEEACKNYRESGDYHWINESIYQCYQFYGNLLHQINVLRMPENRYKIPDEGILYSPDRPDWPLGSTDVLKIANDLLEYRPIEEPGAVGGKMRLLFNIEDVDSVLPEAFLITRNGVVIFAHKSFFQKGYKFRSFFEAGLQILDTDYLKIYKLKFNSDVNL